MNIAANPAPGFVKYPDKKIVLEPLRSAVTVTADGTELARSDDALVMREGDYAPVIYVPFSGIEFANLKRSDTSTHCPFKGDASYWQVADDAGGTDVMWSYENPYDEMVQIKGYAAFYGDRVKIAVG